MDTLGMRIQQLRKKANMTQAELGRRLSISAQAVSKWENDLAEPDISTTKKMCELFGVSVNELLGTTTAVEPKTEQPKSAVTPPQRVAIAHCTKCKKALYTKNEFVIQKSEEYGGIVRENPICLDCHEKIKKQAHIEKVENHNKEFNRKLTWSIVCAVGAFVVLLVVALVMGWAQNSSRGLTLTIFCPIVAGLMVYSLFWSDFIQETFVFFLRSFRMPGVIFTLDLDGIFFLIAVKVIGGILCGLLSAAIFCVGLIVTGVFSIFAFPFAIRDCIADKKNLDAMI